jgi:hypothetical protein
MEVAQRQVGRSTERSGRVQHTPDLCVDTTYRDDHPVVDALRNLASYAMAKFGLTDRELEIVSLVTGLTKREIAKNTVSARGR